MHQHHPRLSRAFTTTPKTMNILISMTQTNSSLRSSKIMMICIVILAALIMFTCCPNTHAARVLDRGAGGETIATTQLPPATSGIDDPANSAATTDSGEENICFRCYDVVKMAQELINIQNDLVKKQRKLLKQKNKAEATASSATPSSTPPPPPLVTMRKPPKQRQNSTQSAAAAASSSSSGQASANTRIRSLENQPIVVSRLRVARSAQAVASADSVWEKLKSKQEQQLNKTCKTLHEVYHCLKGIKGECVGDLQYHTQEVYNDQWLDKLNCPYVNNPNIKPWKGLTRSVPSIQEPERVPVPRPISSPEEVQRRLDAILGNDRSRSPIGVMLKPTLTTSASQKFNSLSETSGQQQSPLNGLADGYPTKGRHLLSSNRILPSSLDGQQQQQPPDSHLLAMTSQLLLVPAFLILVVLFVALASRYIKQARVV